MTSHFYIKQEKFLVSTDCIIFGFNNNKLELLVCERDMDPGRGELSLLGGFVLSGESVDNCAKRIVSELTGLKDIYMQQVGAFGNVDRDPGERVVSIGYYALIDTNEYDDDLRKQFNAKWVDINQLPDLYSDHKLMVEKARMLLQQKFQREPACFNLLGEKFTLSQLQNLYQAVYDFEIDKRNFRKKISEMDYIEKTGEVDKTSSKRGAALYRFNLKKYNKKQNFKL